MARIPFSRATMPHQMTTDTTGIPSGSITPISSPERQPNTNEECPNVYSMKFNTAHANMQSWSRASTPHQMTTDTTGIPSGSITPTSSPERQPNTNKECPNVYSTRFNTAHANMQSWSRATTPHQMTTDTTGIPSGSITPISSPERQSSPNKSGHVPDISSMCPSLLIPLQSQSSSSHPLSLCFNVVSIVVTPDIIHVEAPSCLNERYIGDDDEETQTLEQAGHLILKSVLKNVSSDKFPDESIIIKTPHRFSKMMLEMTEGYRVDPYDFIRDAIFNTHDNNHPPISDDPSTEVVIHDIPVASLCEHHLLPFHGTCSIAYIPKLHVLGLSKFSRVVDAFARRFQLQERLTHQIASFLFDSLHPIALGVKMTANHGCMNLRGVRSLGSSTTTRSFVIDPELDLQSREKFQQQLISLLQGTQ